MSLEWTAESGQMRAQDPTPIDPTPIRTTARNDKEMDEEEDKLLAELGMKKKKKKSSKKPKAVAKASWFDLYIEEQWERVAKLKNIW